MTMREQSAVLDITDAKSITHFGQTALLLLQAYGVGKYYHISLEGLKLAALETVRQTAQRRQTWNAIDTTHAYMRGENFKSFQALEQQLQQTQELYQMAATKQKQYMRKTEIMAAKDAGMRFAAGYWRYRPHPESHRGRLLKTILKRSGQQFTPLGKVIIGIESRLPNKVQLFLANRRAA